MALGWTAASKPANLADLIARKRYGKAIGVLRSQFREGVREPRMRLQLADVLVLAGRPAEAVPILRCLADEFAREGFAAKAIAVLKRLEKLTPGRPDVERRLAELIRQRLGAHAAVPPDVVGGEIGIQDLGIEPLEPSAEPAPADAPAEEEFEEDFLHALQGMIDAGTPSQAAESEPTVAAAAGGPARRPVESPLFGGFSEDELAAVIQNLQLASFEPGEIVVSEGQPGDSLFVLTTGMLKTYVRDRDGRNVFVRDMAEGSFFGELSVLSGRPRSATVTCATRCELLELDRSALAAILAAHPRVQQVIERAAAERSGSEQEMRARGLGPR